MLRSVDVVLVTEDADLHVRSGNRRQLDSARETLVTLGIIVLETNLELDGFCVLLANTVVKFHTKGCDEPRKFRFFSLRE
jgi:hypothetical protein